MKYPGASLIAAAILGAVMLTGCVTIEEIPEDEITTPPVDPVEFRALETASGLFVLSAPEGEKATQIELSGTFAAVGTCLGVTGTEQGNLTVVWPSNSLALQQKPGVEFPSNDWEGDRVRTRLNLNNEVVIAGSFIQEAPWFEGIPEGCAVPEAGVFVISNAHHPAPPPEEEPAEEETEG